MSGTHKANKSGGTSDDSERCSVPGSDDSKSMGDGDIRDSKSDYHDYSRDQALLMLSDETRESVQTFPMKLHSILSNPEFSSIICWLPHGRAWRILQHKAFEDKVIPHYFRHGRYSSFARQVNGWGFKRIASGPDYNSYYHEMFLRGIPRLCEKMKRLSGKDEKKNEENQDAPVPDFYALSRQNPLPEDIQGLQVDGGLDSSTGHEGVGYAPSTASLAGNGGAFLPSGGIGDLSSILGIVQAAGVTTSAGSSGGGVDMLGGLVLQALELRRNEIMQRLASLVAEGFVPSLASPQASSANPLSSILSLLKTQQDATAGNIANLVANLVQNGSNAAPTAKPTVAATGTGFQGLQNFTNQTAALQPACGSDILALLRQQQEQQSKPAAQAPIPSTEADLQQLMNNPRAAALLQQLQGNLLGNSTLGFQAPNTNISSHIFSGSAPGFSQCPSRGEDGASHFRSNLTSSSTDNRLNNEASTIPRGNSSGFQLPPGVDINSLLSGGPNALVFWASLLQNQQSSGSNSVAAPVDPASLSQQQQQQQHKESQTSSPNISGSSGSASSNLSPQPQQSITLAPSNLPAAFTSLLGQMQQNGGQLPPNAAALIGHFGQPNRPSQQGVVSQDQNPLRQQQLSANMNIQLSQLQALLGQQGMMTPNLQAFLGQTNSTSSQNQGTDIRSQAQRQQGPAQSGQVLQGLQNQLLGGNSSISQVQLAALLGLDLGSQGGSTN